MALKPKKSESAPTYPTASEYNNHMRRVLACLAVAGTGMVLDGAAMADEPKKDVRKEGDNQAKGTTEEAKKLALEKIRKEVQANAKKLGESNFKLRREATKRLIAIGSIVEKPKDEPKNRRRPTKPVQPYRTMVVESMEKLLDAKDPEVKERAKLVITALKPKPIRIDRPAIGGVMIAEPIQQIQE